MPWQTLILLVAVILGYWLLSRWMGDGSSHEVALNPGEALIKVGLAREEFSSGDGEYASRSGKVYLTDARLVFAFATGGWSPLFLVYEYDLTSIADASYEFDTSGLAIVTEDGHERQFVVANARSWIGAIAAAQKRVADC